MTGSRPSGTSARKPATSTSARTKRATPDSESSGARSGAPTGTMERSSACSERTCLLVPWAPRLGLCCTRIGFRRIRQRVIVAEMGEDDGVKKWTDRDT